MDRLSHYITPLIILASFTTVIISKISFFGWSWELLNFRRQEVADLFRAALWFTHNPTWARSSVLLVTRIFLEPGLVTSTSKLVELSTAIYTVSLAGNVSGTQIAYILLRDASVFTQQIYPCNNLGKRHQATSELRKSLPLSPKPFLVYQVHP